MGAMDTLQVRCAKDSEITTIWKLTHDQYLSRGYIQPQPDGLYRHYWHLEQISQTTRLLALIDDNIVGTCSYTLDSIDGLTTDIDYPIETRDIRAIGVPLSCVWRLITDNKCRHSGRVANALHKHAMKELEASRVLCIVNPRHAKYYTRRLGLDVVATRDESPGLDNAPSVLLSRSQQVTFH